MIDTSIFEDKTAVYYTLGCKLNFAETSAIGKVLARKGIRKANPWERADICVVNTCSVTDLANAKSRSAIRKVRRDNPNAFLVVTGCYAQLKPEEVLRQRGVDLVLGTEQKLEILEHLEKLRNNDHGGTIITSDTKDIHRFMPACSANDRTRHFLKVQDGCDYCCSYCTIPFARGRSRNGAIADLVKQAEDVVEGGGREIVLTGVNIGDFGKSTGETFLDLLRALDEVKGVNRYRISSIEPNLLTDEIIDFVANSKRFAPHFHIPLQSGCDEVLKLMRRRYNTTLFRKRVEKIKKAIPNAFIGVDVIVGMRGETDDHFEMSYRFIDSLDISQLHVFSYSERPGTQALQIEHTVDKATKHERSQRLLSLSEVKRQQFYRSFVGQKAVVLFECSISKGMIRGYTENYIRVEIPYGNLYVNSAVTVVLGEPNEDGSVLTSKIIE